MEPTSTRGARIANRYELIAPLVDVGVGESWIARTAQGGDARVALLGNASPAQAETLAGLLGTLRALSNPAIVATVDAGVSDGRAWSASEPFDGRSLANWIEGHRQAGTRPGFGMVQRLFDRVASALQAAHAAGVVHGALSSRCVVLKRLGAGQHHARIVDFALGPFTVSATAAASWFDYQAPEQRGPRTEDGPAVDVFAAAVLLAEMLTLSAGPRPDARETWAQFAREAKAPGIADRLASLRNDVPRGVWEVIAGTLAASPRERSAGVLRLQRAVREAWSAAGEWDRTGQSEPDPPPPDPSRVRAPQAPAPQRARSHSAIEGWQSAERAQVPVVQRVATAVAGTPVAASAKPVAAPVTPVAAPATVQTPVYTPEVPVEDATEAIDLEAAARYLQELHGAPTPMPPRPSQEHLAYPSFEPEQPDVKESTRAIDAAEFYAAQMGGGGDLDDGGGTAVRAQGGDIAAAIAAADAARRGTDESTRMLDVAAPDAPFDPRPSFAPWAPGSDLNGVPDPYGGGAAFGVDDPFSDPRSSLPMPPPTAAPAPGAWSAPPQGASPFVATLKAVPRGSIPSAPPAMAAPPSPQKLWGAAPPARVQPAPPPAKQGVPAWQWALLAVVVAAVTAAILAAMRGR